MLQLIDQLTQEGHHQAALQHALNLLKDDAYANSAQLMYKIASLYDVQGFEKEAIPFYQQAIANNLEEKDLPEAYLGLGSTFRTLGRYQESLETFENGLVRFPDAVDLRIFRAMTLYNLGQNKRAVSELLLLLAENSQHPHVTRYKRAMTLYSEDLDRVWS
ncbi:tetratricopeptide repeat protein [Rouxiella sp. Mn2063]|uniref:tetratricopeptide repeat protein n=1 Tax=Rouxiella sp. Mn2063 TaxID=3395262 RepID=UPI003BE45E5C